MTTALAKLKASHARASKTENFGPFFAQLSKDVAACVTPADLDRLFRSPMCSEGVFDEGELDGAVVDALVRLAVATKSAATSAAALGWAVRATAFHPYAHLEPDRPSTKHGPLAALSKHRADLLELVRSADVERRAAAAYALCATQGLTDADHAMLLTLLADEPAALARASLFVGLLAVGHRGEIAAGRAEQLRAIASRTLDDVDELVAFSAAACLAVLHEASPKVVARCASALEHPTRLPRGWGWFWEKPKMLETGSLAIWVARHASRCPDPASWIAALVAHEPIHQGEALDIGSALVHLAFAARGRELAETGLLRSDVDTSVERCLRWLAGRPEFEQRAQHSRLGLRHDDLLPFLSAKDAAWKPIPLTLAGRPAKLHLARVYLHVGLGELAEDAAIEAVLSTLPATRLVTLVFDKTPTFAEADARLTTEEQRTRACRFQMSLARRLVEQSKVGLAARLSRPTTSLPIALGLWLESHDLTDAQVPVAVEAMGDASSREPLASLLRARATAAQLEAIVRQSYALEFFDLCVSEATLDHLFGILRDYPDSRTTTLEALRRARPGADDVLRRYAARRLDVFGRGLLADALTD